MPVSMTSTAFLPTTMPTLGTSEAEPSGMAHTWPVSFSVTPSRTSARMVRAFVSTFAVESEGGQAPSFEDKKWSQTPVLFVVVLVVFIIIVFDTGVSHGAATTLATLHGDDNRARLHLRTSVEDNNSLAGGAQQALVFENLEYAARHFTRATHEA